MLVVIKGAGDLASGIALRLVHSGFKVVMTELPNPLAIRRTVAFCEAVRMGKMTVEDVTAKHAQRAEDVMRILDEGFIPVIVDPEAEIIEKIKPDVVIDAIIAKKNLGTLIDDAKVVIGIGPGFTAGTDCHAVIESMRGHTLGRVIYEGGSIPNTNVPGRVGGFAGERLLRAPATGIFESERAIGDMVKTGDVVGWVCDKPMVSTIDGVLRGLIANGTQVKEGLKSGDVDPRGIQDYCNLVSDKALAIAGGVLEAIFRLGVVERRITLSAEEDN